jgi:hypothetical protein
MIPDLPMDVLLYSLDFQWPFCDTLLEDLNEIARRSCVSKQFHITMKKLKDLRIGYHLMQYPSICNLSPDVQQFATEVIKSHTRWDGNDPRTTSTGTVINDILSSEASGPCHSAMGNQLTDFAIQWRFRASTTNFNLDFPRALSTLYLMLFKCLFCGAQGAKSESGNHDDLCMWLVFYANIESILNADDLSGEDMSLLVYFECDHIHNGFRTPGNIADTIGDPKGFYYRVMQRTYVAEYERNEVTKLALVSGSNKEALASSPALQLPQLFVARFRRIWDYQEACRVAAENAVPDQSAS